LQTPFDLASGAERDYLGRINVDGIKALQYSSGTEPDCYEYFLSHPYMVNYYDRNIQIFII